jgi:hypothetical protein
MDFLSFFEMHIKPVSVFCDCLIAAQWNQIAIDGIRDKAAVCRRSGVGIVCHKMGSSASHESRKSESRKTQLRSSCHQEYTGETRYESK